MRLRNVIAAIAAITVTNQGLAQDDLSTKKLSYALLPEGKTLPAGVARFRLPYQMASGSTAYDDAGKKSDSPVKFSAKGGAFVAEYGLTDKISLQWKTDFVLSQKTEMAGNRAWEKDGYTGAVAKRTDLQALQALTNVTIDSRANFEKAATLKALNDLKTGNACTDIATDCVAFLAGNSPTAVATRKGIADQVAATDALVYEGVKKEALAEGGRGMGDTILGVLYEAYDSGGMFVALAGGVRVPTGNRDLSGTELSTSRSAWEVGARINVDMLPVDWFMISWQNQSEVGIAGAKHKVDGVSVETKRDGVRNVGFVYLKPSLEAVAPGLDSLRASVGITYDFDSAQKLTSDGETETTPHSSMIWNYASLGYSMLHMGIPLQLDLEHEMPNRGKNAKIAATKTTVTAKAFMKF